MINEILNTVCNISIEKGVTLFILFLEYLIVHGLNKVDRQNILSPIWKELNKETDCHPKSNCSLNHFYWIALDNLHKPDAHDLMVIIYSYIYIKDSLAKCRISCFISYSKSFRPWSREEVTDHCTTSTMFHIQHHALFLKYCVILTPDATGSTTYKEFHMCSVCV